MDIVMVAIRSGLEAARELNRNRVIDLSHRAKNAATHNRSYLYRVVYETPCGETIRTDWIPKSWVNGICHANKKMIAVRVEFCHD